MKETAEWKKSKDLDSAGRGPAQEIEQTSWHKSVMAQVLS
jgi:hypothetical protein